MNKHDLILLLQSNKQSQIISDCLNDLTQERAVIKHNDYPPFLSQKVKMDYKIRAEINEEMAGSSQYTRGYSELLSALDKYTEETLKIIWVTCSQRDYWIFISSNDVQILGILDIPKISA